MLLFLDSCPPSLSTGAPWDALAGLSVDGKTLYGVGGLRIHGDAIVLAVAFDAGGAARPAWFRSFKRCDLPALKATARRLAPSAKIAVSFAGHDDAGFVKITKAFGWRGHMQTAVLDL